VRFAGLRPPLTRPIPPTRNSREAKFKGSELSPLGTFDKKIPADLVTKVRAKEKAIYDGKFSVKVDDNQPKPTAK
jgi:hypothetical protein